jgi:hypothetical protein
MMGWQNPNTARESARAARFLLGRTGMAFMSFLLTFIPFASLPCDPRIAGQKAPAEETLDWRINGPAYDRLLPRLRIKKSAIESCLGRPELTMIDASGAVQFWKQNWRETAWYVQFHLIITYDFEGTMLEITFPQRAK